MPRYQVYVRDRSPLAIQLTAGATGALITSWDAHGSNSVGETTRPCLYRPSARGYAASDEPAPVTRLDSSEKAEPLSEVITTFGVLPSPVETEGQVSNALPYRSSLLTEVYVEPGESIVLYAGTDFEGSREEDPSKLVRVHLWNAELTWEEN